MRLISISAFLAFVGAVLLSVLGGGSADASANPQVGEACHTSDPGHICLAIHYMSYKDPASGAVAVSAQSAANNLRAINQVWSQCNISFEIEHYDAVNPSDYGLAYGTDAQPQTDQIRKRFSDSATLLILTTGPWQGTVKNAWTNPPGSAEYGAIIDGNVATFPLIIAHELGHYLGLNHSVESPQNDEPNVMNWMTYPDSNKLSSQQCQLARATSQQDWKSMQR